MKRLAAVAGILILLGACGSSAKQAVRSDAAAVTTTSVSGAEQPGGGPAVEPTTTTAAPLGVAPTTSTSAPRGVTTTVRAAATTTTAKAATVVQEATTTTTAAPQATTTTTGAPGTTTTTRALQPVSALTIKGACQSGTQFNIPMSFAEGVDLPRLKADLAAQGYELPSTFQFRYGTGQPVPMTMERNTDDARQQWKNCFDAQGGKKLVVTIATVAGEAGSPTFANLVKSEMDEIPNMAPYGSYTVA